MLQGVADWKWKKVNQNVNEREWAAFNDINPLNEEQADGGSEPLLK